MNLIRLIRNRKYVNSAVATCGLKHIVNNAIVSSCYHYRCRFHHKTWGRPLESVLCTVVNDVVIMSLSALWWWWMKVIASGCVVNSSNATGNSDVVCSLLESDNGRPLSGASTRQLARCGGAVAACRCTVLVHQRDRLAWRWRSRGQWPPRPALHCRCTSVLLHWHRHCYCDVPQAWKGWDWGREGLWRLRQVSSSISITAIYTSTLCAFHTTVYWYALSPMRRGEVTSVGVLKPRSYVLDLEAPQGQYSIFLALALASGSSPWPWPWGVSPWHWHWPWVSVLKLFMLGAGFSLDTMIRLGPCLESRVIILFMYSII